MFINKSNKDETLEKNRLSLLVKFNIVEIHGHHYIILTQKQNGTQPNSV